MDKSQLEIYNSLTRKKELFVANGGKTIDWYCCGPTVYDAAHLGHARCYITFDIIRRILTGYFGYQVDFVMNVTDIDDKIIKRARANYLCDKFIEKFTSDLKGSSSASDKQALAIPIKKAVDNYKKQHAGEQDKDKLVMIQNVIKNSEIAMEELIKELANEGDEDKVLGLLERLRDTIGDEQDALLGHTVTDHQLFKNHASKFEQEFHDDMLLLDVLEPSALTRVSEFIDDVGEYIVKIEQNGFAYRSSDGSIYFDTEKFDAEPKHSYAKLVRENYVQKTDYNEGELGKKSPNDFALWKKSKTGEPSWQTQDFDAGRPGWHIECSAMASKLLGENIDIHSGGHDLRFPHHDNEIAQAEAYYNTGKNWVNYFLHSGHLTISGCKMSKSLKNFITIKQALNEYSSRQLRFAFLAHKWDGNLDYSPNTMRTALTYEKTFKEFLLNVTDTLRDLSTNSRPALRRSNDDCKLVNEFKGTFNKVHAALCDNFDTRKTLDVLSALVKECNKRKLENLHSKLIKDIATFIKHILSIFGTNFDVEFNTANQQASSNQGESLKYADALAQFRADVKTKCRGSDPLQSTREILGLCDRLRDLILPELGCQLEDRQSGDRPYVVKFVDPETLAREREQNKQKAARRKKK